jgi:hypothetical protein
MLAQTMLLMVPLDVSNARIGGSMDMKNFWYSMLMITSIFIFLIIPVMMFWSESAEELLKWKIWYIVKWEILVLIIASLVSGISYAILRFA